MHVQCCATGCTRPAFANVLMKAIRPEPGISLFVCEEHMIDMQAVLVKEA